MRTLRTASGPVFAALMAITIAGCADNPDTVCCDEELTPVCGDGYCSWLEFGVCFEDCVLCGDAFCDEREDESCTRDCFVCGDGECGDGERGWCIMDCHQCTNQITYRSLVSCDDVQYCGMDLNDDGVGDECDVCGDGVCTWLEDVGKWCPDCPEYGGVCGDGDCWWWELGVCEDCWMVCGDHVCNDGEDVDACPDDCALCGDGVCDFNDETDYDEAEFCNVDCFSHGS